jgi:transcription initiation factor TFIIIB Brf1 subunit/transcription initiation factor TFIIB
MLNFITQSRIVCSTCSSDRVIHDPESGEVICSSCGMVISDRIQNITMPVTVRNRYKELKSKLLS